MAVPYMGRKKALSTFSPLKMGRYVMSDCKLVSGMGGYLLGMGVLLAGCGGADDAPVGLNAVEKEILEQCAAYKSVTAKMTVVVEVNARGETRQVQRGQGSCQCLRRDGKRLFRQELKLEQVGAGVPSGTRLKPATMLAVGDGEFVYSLSQVGGEGTAYKRDQNLRSEPWPTAIIQTMLVDFDTNLLPEEEIGGKPAYVIEGRFKEGRHSEYPPPTMVWYFQKDRGLPVKTVESYENGSTRTTTFTDIKLNVDIDPGHFKFQLPKGVRLVDLTTRGQRGLPTSARRDKKEASPGPAPGASMTIHEAARKGNIEEVEANLDGGCDVNARDRKGRTALHLAVMEGNYAVARFLLARGADANATARWLGRAPLHIAAEQGDKAMAELLLANAADVNAKRQLGTPLHYAARKNRKAVVDFLLSRGADVNAVNGDGKVPLDAAAWGEGGKDVVELLIGAGADVNFGAKSGETALRGAAFKGKRDVVELLLANGADTPPKALHSAATKGHIGVVELLLANGADVNAKCSDPGDRHTALMCAAAEGHKNVAEFLISKGADVNARWPGRRTALHHATLHSDVVELLLSKGADPNAKDDAGWRPLHSAMRKGGKGAAELLLAAGADVNAKRGTMGATPLHRAAEDGLRDLVELLLAKDADVHVRNRDGWTPLHFGAHGGNNDVLELLLAKGADVNARAQNEETPLHRAAARGYEHAVELLLLKGADLNAKTNDGKTALGLAVGQRHNDVVAVLRKHGAEE